MGVLWVQDKKKKKKGRSNLFMLLVLVMFSSKSKLPFSPDPTACKKIQFHLGPRLECEMCKAADAFPYKQPVSTNMKWLEGAELTTVQLII